MCLHLQQVGRAMVMQGTLGHAFIMRFSSSGFGVISWVCELCKLWIMVVLPTHMNIVVEVSLHLVPCTLGCSMYTWMFHGHAFLAPVDREWLHTIAFADAIEAALS